MIYTYINEDQIDLELICAICNDPFQSPMNCRLCGNTYCEKCIMKWFEQQTSCPSCRQIGNYFSPVISRVVLNQLNRLSVQCKLCQQIDIQRSNFTDHMSCTCPKQIVKCTDNCGWNGHRENLEEHLIKCRQNQVLGCRISQWWKTGVIIILAIILFFIFEKSDNRNQT